jgi:hypothetical protein
MEIVTEIELKASVLRFGRGWFIHVAQQMQVHYSGALTPFSLYKFSTGNFFVEILYNLFNETSFPAALLVLGLVFGLSLFLSYKFPYPIETLKQINSEYTALEQSGFMTNAEKWDFFLAYLDSGVGIFLLLDLIKHVDYFILVRSVVQAYFLSHSSYYTGMATVVSKITPTPLNFSTPWDLN